MSDARPNFFDFDVTKMFADFPLRAFDVEAVWAAQRRNVEAFSRANQLAVEGFQAVAKRQMEVTQQSFEELSALLRDMAQPVSAQDRVVRQADYAKNQLDKGLNHGRDLATMAAKTGGDVAEVLHRRTAEGLDEIRGFACKTAATTAATPV